MNLIIDKEKAMLYGVAPQQIAYTMNMALSNRAITNLYDEDAPTKLDWYWLWMKRKNRPSQIFHN